MTRTLYFVGGEDFDFSSIGEVSVDTTSSHRRPSFSRCSLNAADGSAFWDTGDVTGGVTTAWFHTRVWMTANFTAGSYLSPDGTLLSGEIPQMPIRITDANGVVRLGIHFAANQKSNTTPAYWRFVKTDELGAMTQLGAVFSGCFSGSPAAPDALDIGVFDYGADGLVKVYINNTLVFAYSGNIATDANEEINGLRCGGIHHSADYSIRHVAMSYSEVIVAAEDTRGLELATLTPSEDGNTDNWTTGGVDNINEIVLDDATGNTSLVAGQIQQYKVTAPPAGSYGVIAVCVAARAQQGSLGGPTQIDLGVRTNSADYWGSDITLPITKQRVRQFFMTNPDTGGAFTIPELTDTDFNIGMKSVT